MDDLTGEALLAESVVTAGEAAVRAWLKANRAILKGRAPDEVARLAVLADFPVADVCMTLVNFRDAMQGSYIDGRAAYQGWLFDRAVARVHAMQDEQARLKAEDEKAKQPDFLMVSWQHLAAYQATGEITEGSLA